MQFAQTRCPNSEELREQTKAAAAELEVERDRTTTLLGCTAVVFSGDSLFRLAQAFCEQLPDFQPTHSRSELQLSTELNGQARAVSMSVQMPEWQPVPRGANAMRVYCTLA